MLNDVIWIRLSKETDTPGRLYSNSHPGVNMLIWDVDGGYRLVDSEKGSFDVFGGFRFMTMETNIKLGAGNLPAVDVSEKDLGDTYRWWTWPCKPFARSSSSIPNSISAAASVRISSICRAVVTA